MLVRVLGSVAGGGVPQCNCGCEHCVAAVCNPALARSGCSVAVTAEGSAWTVLNARTIGQDGTNLQRDKPGRH
jgi:pyrroloquinoline quinone biosynthesis protein B